MRYKVVAVALLLLGAGAFTTAVARPPECFKTAPCDKPALSCTRIMQFTTCKQRDVLGLSVKTTPEEGGMYKANTIKCSVLYTGDWDPDAEDCGDCDQIAGSDSSKFLLTGCP